MAWSLAPQALPDETVSSWLCRCALAHGADPVRFAGALWPRLRTWSRDVDRFSPERLQALTSYGSPDLAALPSDSRWIVPASIRGHKRIGRTPFCPSCWAQDARPYYRRAWRFSWYVVCEQHDALLRDRCPACDAALAPHLLPVGESTLARCDRCGVDVRVFANEQERREVPAFQRQAQAAFSGDGTWWGWNLTSDAWFATVRFWMALTRLGTRGYASPIAKFTMRVAPSFPVGRARGDFNKLPVEARAALLDALAPFASLDAATALANAKACGLRQHHVQSWARDVPAAAAWVQDLPAREKVVSRAPRQQRYGFGHPRPPHEVAVLYDRLLRATGRR